MKVSKVEILPIRPREGLIGFATVELDGQILLNSIAIHSKRDGSGYRLTYPTRSNGDSAITVFHPTSPQLSWEIERMVFARVREIFEI